MGKPRFEYAAKTLIKGADACFRNQLWIPGLILIYSGINILASLNRYQTEENKKGIDAILFKRWANTFLLPGARLGCNSDELWGARCGLLHKYSSESEKSRSGKRKEIFYEFGDNPATSKEFRAKCIKAGTKVIDISKLMTAFIRSVQRFNIYLGKNPRRAEVVYNRADKLFGISIASI
jgi:hypothetical protein